MGSVNVSSNHFQRGVASGILVLSLFFSGCSISVNNPISPKKDTPSGSSSSVASVFTKTLFVRSGASGASTGNDWNNAWGSFASVNWNAVVPGSLLCVAGGSYLESLQLQASGTAAQRIVIRRAITADPYCGLTSQGWNAAYDAQVIIDGGTESSVVFGSSSRLGSYVTLEGQVDSGIKVIAPNVDSKAGIAFLLSGADGVNLQHLEVAGPASSSSFAYAGDVRGISAVAWGPVGPGGSFAYDSINDLAISNCRIHGASSLLYFMNVQRGVVENSKLYDNRSSAGTSSVFQSGSSSDAYFRFNEIWNWDAEGILLEFATAQARWSIYANLWHDSPTGSFARVLDVQSVAQGPVYFYNNTIANSTYLALSASNGGSYSAGTSVQNNLFWNAPTGDLTAITHDYNFTDSVNTEANGVGSGSNPFVSLATGDYHIVSTSGATYPRNKGLALSAEFDRDFAGNLRDADKDGSWDIGAYEAGP